jgi:hypothetical protein
MENIDLSGLKDIHIPMEPFWWPPAIGWIILIVGIFSCVFIGIIIYLIWRKQPKQYALRKLKRIYKASQNTILMARQISILLKRVALLKYPREKVASLSEEKWGGFLAKQTGKALTESQINLLVRSTYMREDTVVQISRSELYRASIFAIKKLFENARKKYD